VDRFNQLRSFVVAKVSEETGRNASHGKAHLERVCELGTLIGKKEHADLEILKPALILHDLVRPAQEKEENDHAQMSARAAEEILVKFGYSGSEIAKIRDAILSHSRTDLAGRKKTLEAKILYDADKIDGLGKVGIERAKTLCGARGYCEEKTAEWYLGRIIDVLKEEPPYTEEGRSIASGRLDASLAFCKKSLGERYDAIMKKELGTTDPKL
jgi:uncharacterized protein